MCENEVKIDRSENINELAKALSVAQIGFKPIKKTANNPFFNSKYATLDNVIEATKDSLKENGLAITQLPCGNVIKTLLIHQSGQWIGSDTPLHADKKGPQGYGSALTYGRRYALSAILNVSSEDDDDGHVAQHQKVIQTSIPKQYDELVAKADTIEKWDKLEVWLRKQKASNKMIDQYFDDRTKFEKAINEQLD